MHRGRGALTREQPGADVRLKLDLPEINLQVVKRISGFLKPDARQEYFREHITRNLVVPRQCRQWRRMPTVQLLMFSKPAAMVKKLSQINARRVVSAPLRLRRS